MWARLFACLFLLFPLTAHATGQWENCGGVAITDTSIQSGGKICWVFTTTEDSTAFTVRASVAEVCFDPNVATEGAAAGKVYIRKCHLGTKPASNPQYQCIRMSDAPLDGTQGSPGTQNSCQDVERGTYYIDNDTSAGGVTAVVSVTAD